MIKREFIKKNPTKYINSLKTDQKIPNFIKEKDIEFLFKNINLKENLNGQRDLLILELLYGTGIRVSELINLKIQNINLSKKEIKVLGKRNKERIIPFSNRTQENLQLFIKRYDIVYYLFTNKKT